MGALMPGDINKKGQRFKTLPLCVPETGFASRSLLCCYRAYERLFLYINDVCSS